MQVFSIDTGKFKLDGGAMFGVVPKSIWNKLNPADENNLCTWALRCLLVIEGDRKILIDTGMGAKQDEKFFSHYHPHDTLSLVAALRKVNMTTTDITDVLLTHLHFDHVGGAVIRENENLSLQFPNATYWVSEPQWNEAMQPNQREKASFLADNILPLQQSGQLKTISLPLFDSSKQLQEIHFSPSISCFVVNGHTKGMLIPKINLGAQQVVFMADLLPSVGHIPLPYIMGYDMQPLITLAEKEMFLKQAVQHDYTLFFEHDAQHECCNLQETDKGIRVKSTFNLNSLV
ncbi:MAG: MBL fold metallo-hydrolase [Bacteroidetes bacterium]|nr:MBL fold metallo-hydrolase [Bacteroidota bacterium]